MTNESANPTLKSKWDGQIFLPDSLIHHVELIRMFVHAPPAVVNELFQAIHRAELVHIAPEIDKHAAYVRERLALTDLGARGYDLDAIALQNARMIFGKLSTAALLLACQNNPVFVDEHVEIEGLHHLQAALGRGNGVVLSLLHWGLFQSFNTLLAALGYRSILVADRVPCEYLTRIQGAFAPEKSHLVDTIPTGDLGLLIKATAALRQNQILCLLPELSEGVQPPRLHVPFLGTSIHAPEGPAFLAGASGAPLLPSRLEVNGPGKIKLVFGEPIWVASSKREQAEEVTRQFWRYLESAILAQPERWCGWEILDRMQVREEFLTK